MVKRYDATIEYNRFACEEQVVFDECSDGDYVTFEDYQVLQQQNAQLFADKEERGRVANDLQAEIDNLLETLAFYADPDSYFAVSVLADRPCGTFADDFSEDHTTEEYGRPMPGKKARAVLIEYATKLESGE